MELPSLHTGGILLLYSTDGRQVLSHKILPNNSLQAINISGLQTGTYFYKILLPDMNPVQGRIILNAH
jgi:hypothetical protein